MQVKERLLLLAMVLLAMGMTACTAPPSTVTPTPTLLAILTLTPTSTHIPPTVTPTATVTNTPTPTTLPPTPTATPSPTPTLTVTPTPAIADRVPKGPNQPFSLTITEEELTKLAAKEMADLTYSAVQIYLHPDELMLKGQVYLGFGKEKVGTVEFEAKGPILIVEGRPWFEIEQLISDKPLSPFWMSVLTDSLSKGAYLFLLPILSGADIESVTMLEGKMVVEGRTK